MGRTTEDQERREVLSEDLKAWKKLAGLMVGSSWFQVEIILCDKECCPADNGT